MLQWGLLFFFFPLTDDRHFVCEQVLRRWKHRWNKSANRTPPLLWYKQVSKCPELAIRCTDTKPTNRPDIWDIICELNKVDSGSDVSDAAEWLELEGMIGVEPLEIHLPFQLNKKIYHALLSSAIMRQMVTTLPS